MIWDVIEVNVNDLFCNWLICKLLWEVVNVVYDELRIGILSYVDELLWNWLIVYDCSEWFECGICWVEEWDIDLCWRLKNDLSYEIVDGKFVKMDWSDELCELLVFDGNELLV